MKNMPGKTGKKPSAKKSFRERANRFVEKNALKIAGYGTGAWLLGLAVAAATGDSNKAPIVPQLDSQPEMVELDHGAVERAKAQPVQISVPKTSGPKTPGF